MLALLAEPVLWRPLSLPPGPLSLLPDSTAGSPGHVSHSSGFGALASIPPKLPHPWLCVYGPRFPVGKHLTSGFLFLCNGSSLSVALPNILVFMSDRLGGSVFTLCCRRGILVGEAFLLLFNLSEGMDHLDILSRGHLQGTVKVTPYFLLGVGPSPSLQID